MKIAMPLLRLPRQYSAEALVAEIAALPQSAWLPHPGRLVGNDAVPLITPEGKIGNGFSGEMAPTEHLEACPYIKEIMADLDGVWGRSRLMGLAAGADVPEHVDVGYYWRTHLRIHIPIITNPKVVFTCDGESVHMAPGECWVFDSFRMHNVRNGGDAKRVHLVIDTVGGEQLWDLINEAQDAGGKAEPKYVAPGSAMADKLAYERINTPETMSSWEVRCHIDHVIGQTAEVPKLAAVKLRLERFANGWAAAWAQYGAAAEGQGRYRQLVETIRIDLKRLGADRILLPNQVPLDRALDELIFMVAVPARPNIPVVGRGAPVATNV